MRRIEHAFEASLGQVLPETGYEQINQLIQKNADLFSAKGERNGFCTSSPIRCLYLARILDGGFR